MRVSTVLNILLLFVLFSLVTPQKATARLLFSDNFDDGDISDWSVVKNKWWENDALPCWFLGAPAQWTAYLGAIGIEIWGPGCITEIIPANVSLLDEHPNYVYEFDMTMPITMHMDRNYILKWKDIRNIYGMKVMDNWIYLEKGVDGAGFRPDGSYAQYPFQPDRTYRFKNIIQNNHIQVYVDSDLVLDFDDPIPRFDGGAPGFRASVGSIDHSITWYDNVSVSSIDTDVSLQVPYLSQRDIHWKDQIYDHADTWASQTPSFERWGCAVTSAAMALQFNVTTILPNDNHLDPGSLNTWLREQPDGYIGNGLVNWLALTRLAYQVSLNHHEIPPLEYSHISSWDDANTALQHNSPVIMNLGSHFVVAKGTSREGNIFSLFDPFNAANTQLTREQAFKSAHVFSQSNTDLSYIMVVYPQSLNVSFGDHDGQTTNEEVDAIQDDTSGTPSQNEATHIKLLKKPNTGEFQINVTSDNSQESQLTIYTYTNKGEVQLFHEQGFFSTTPKQFSLSYNKEQSSAVSFSLSQELTQLWEAHEIQKAFLYRILQKNLNYLLADNEIVHKQRYIHLFLYHLEQYKQYLTSNAYEILKRDIETQITTL